MTTPEIYPIYLNDSTAEHLTRKHLWKLFDEKSLYASRCAEYRYSAKVLESGDVEVCVTYSSDDGFIMCSGALFTSVIRPFTDDELLNIKQNRMFALAAQEYAIREDEKARNAILAIHKEMFGCEVV